MFMHVRFQQGHVSQVMMTKSWRQKATIRLQNIDLRQLRQRGRSLPTATVDQLAGIMMVPHIYSTVVMFALWPACTYIIFIYNRQKLKRLQLEQQVRDLESKLRDTILSQSTHTAVQHCVQNKQLEQEVKYESQFNMMWQTGMQLIIIIALLIPNKTSLYDTRILYWASSHVTL